MLHSRTSRDVLIVALAFIGVAFYVLMAHVMGGPGFPLDDSWIHQTYARNLGQTGIWAYVPGVPSGGSTSPFYTILLAIGYALHLPFLFWTYTLGAIFLAMGGLVGMRLGERLYPSVQHVGLWTGLAMVTAWHLVWAAASGMETMLFAALTLIVIDLAWGEIGATADPRSRFGRGALFGIIGAILIAARPEGILLLALLGFLMLIARPQGGWQSFTAWSAGVLVGGLIGIAPYLLLNLSLNGSILPNTFSAKQAEVAELRAQPFVVNLWAMAQPLLAGGELLLIPGMVWGIVGLYKPHPLTLSPLRSEGEPRGTTPLSMSMERGGGVRQTLGVVVNLLYLAPLLWAMILILVYVLRLPAYYQHGRYVIPAVAPFIAFSVGGLIQLASYNRRAMIRRVLGRTLAITALGLFGVFWFVGGRVFGQDVQMIQSDMVVASRWVAQNIPPDQLLAVHDIGAVGYFAPRPMLDLAGLISPEVIPIIRDAGALMRLMEQRGVRYLMVLPPQRPAAANDPRLCKRFNAGGMMGGMAIYELAWDGHCR